MYTIICEDRDIIDIQNDYHNGLWISKDEVIRLMEYEKQLLLDEMLKYREETSLLLSDFKLATMRSYQNTQ